MLGEKAADEGGRDRPDIDPHVEDGESRVAARIRRGIKAADHRGNVRLEEAGAERDQGQARKESGLAVERHGEMAEGDDAAAPEDGAAGADEIIRDESAQNAEQVAAHGVGAVDGGGALVGEPQPALGDSEGHEQHEQRPHPIEAETLPHLGEKQRREAAWLAADPAGGQRIEGGNRAEVRWDDAGGGVTHAGRSLAGAAGTAKPKVRFPLAFRGAFCTFLSAAS